MISQDIKRKVWETIDATQNDLTKLCSDIVRVPSENPPGDTRELAKFVKEYLKQQGFEVAEYEPKPKNISLVSTIRGLSEKPHLVMNAHLDVFPAEVGEPWSTDPFGGEIKDGKIFGRGAGDMKGGFTASLMAFCLVGKLDRQIPGKLTLMLVSDEETGGRWGAEWLLKKYPHLKGDACINGEPSGMTVRLGEKGKAFTKLRAYGQPGHAGLGQFSGRNAIVEIMKAIPIIQTFPKIRGKFTKEQEALLPEVKKGFETYSPHMGKILDHITVNVGTIKGGAKVNIIPGSCEAEVDVRLPLGIKPKWFLNELQTRLRKAKLHVKAEFMDMPVVEANYTSPRERIVQLAVENATEATGERPNYSLTGGRTDCCYFRERGVPAVVYGPRAFNIAAADEHILIDHLVKVTKVHAGVAVDFFDWS